MNDSVSEDELALVDMDIDGTSVASSDAGTMVVRVWTEEGREEGFRARLTFTAPHDEPSSLVFAGDREQVIEAIREWLSRMAR